jgi:arylformamidase
MRFYDISVGISTDLPVWPGDPLPEMARLSRIVDGDSCNVTQITSTVHTGTHVDAPLHYIEGGRSVENLSLEALIGRAYVIDLPKALILDAKTLERAGIPPRTRRVLFKTKNSLLWAQGVRSFQKDFVGLDPSGAEWIVRKGMQLVGVDYLSVTAMDQCDKTHRILLQAGVILLEGINLNRIRQGRYTLYCLPVKIVGSEGAPARAILAGV